MRLHRELGVQIRNFIQDQTLLIISRKQHKPNKVRSGIIRESFSVPSCCIIGGLAQITQKIPNTVCGFSTYVEESPLNLETFPFYTYTYFHFHFILSYVA